MAFFAVHELHLTFEQALFKESASRIMLMLNQSALNNVGDDKVMTLSDIEEIEKLKKLKK